MTGLQFTAAIFNSLAWPAAFVAGAVLLRRELGGAIQRIRSLEFAGGRAEFAALPDYGKIVTAVAKEPAGPDADAAVRHDVTEFSVAQALASAAPRRAVIEAWGLLESQLDFVSDLLAPNQPHGWPQVAKNLQAWDKWPVLYPVVVELRRLRDYTVQSARPPSSADAARYVSVVQDLVTTIRTSEFPESGDSPGGANE